MVKHQKNPFSFKKIELLEIRPWQLQPLKQAQNACFNGSRMAQMHQCVQAKIEKMGPPLSIFQKSSRKNYVMSFLNMSYSALKTLKLNKTINFQYF